LALHFLGNFAIGTYSIETETKELQVVNYRWSQRNDRLSNEQSILQIRRALKEESDMKCETSKKGFTLVELMIVIAIVAILMALAIPSYTQYIRKSNRGEAQQLLMNWANNQELWRATHTRYASDTDIPVPASAGYKYTFAVTDDTPTTFTLTATPKSGTDQVNDKEHGTPCTALTLDQSNDKMPPECW